MNGIINIDKAKDWTSQDVLSKLKRVFKRLGVKKIGHTGTLDPMATGLLTVCIGKATRIIEYLDGDLKSYHCIMKLGMATDTLDITGEPIELGDFSHVTEEMVREAFESYTGLITQIPPKYSALKLNGRPLYEYARSGQDIDISIKKREIYIESIELNSVNLKDGIVSFIVTCSKGTYVRTICDDIGRNLGCFAVMTELRRISNGIFTIEDAYTVDDIIGMCEAELKSCIFPIDTALVNLGIINIDDKSRKKFVNGMRISDKFYKIVKHPKTKYEYEVPEHMNFYRVYNRDEFLGSASIDKNNDLKAEKVIIEDADF